MVLLSFVALFRFAHFDVGLTHRYDLVIPQFR